MSPEQYKAARATLGLTSKQAGAWLGVSPRTADNYAAKGLPGPAARAVGIAVALKKAEKIWANIHGGSYQVYDCDDLAPLLPTFSAGEGG